MYQIWEFQFFMLGVYEVYCVAHYMSLPQLLRAFHSLLQLSQQLTCILRSMNSDLLFFADSEPYLQIINNLLLIANTLQSIYMYITNIYVSRKASIRACPYAPTTSCPFAPFYTLLIHSSPERRQQPLGSSKHNNILRRPL